MLTPDTPLVAGIIMPYYVYFDMDMFFTYMAKNRIAGMLFPCKVNLPAEQALVHLSCSSQLNVYIVLISDYAEWQLAAATSNIVAAYNRIIDVSELKLVAPIVMPPFRMYTKHLPEGAFNGAVINFEEEDASVVWTKAFSHLRRDFRF